MNIQCSTECLSVVLGLVYGQLVYIVLERITKENNYLLRWYGGFRYGLLDEDCALSLSSA